MEFLQSSIPSGYYNTCAKIALVKTLIQDPPTDLPLVGPTSNVDPSPKPNPLIKSNFATVPDLSTKPDPPTKPDPTTKPNPLPNLILQPNSGVGEPRELAGVGESGEIGEENQENQENQEN